MHSKQVEKLIVAGLLIVIAGVSMQPKAVSASSAAKVIKTTNIKNSKAHLSSGNIYSSNKLTKVSHKGKNYKHTTFTRYTQVTVKKSTGKTAIYQYIKAGNVKGWVWHSYLKSGNAPKVAKTSSSDEVVPDTAANEAKFEQYFLADLNAERTKRGLTPMTESAGLDKVADVRATQLTVVFEHQNADGQWPWDVGDAMGVTVGGECICEQTAPSSLADAAKMEVHEYIYNDADSNWGHRDIMLDPENTLFGNGYAYSKGMLYTAQDYD